MASLRNAGGTRSPTTRVSMIYDCCLLYYSTRGLWYRIHYTTVIPVGSRLYGRLPHCGTDDAISVVARLPSTGNHGGFILIHD